MIPELLLVLLVLAAVYGVVAHNRFVRQQALVESSWRRVEDELERRQELVPALEAVVRDYAEEDARSLREALAAVQATPGAEAEQRLSAALHRLPPGPWEALMAQIAESEDRIAAAKRFHDSNVRALQHRREAFPSSLVARTTGVEPPEERPALL